MRNLQTFVPQGHDWLEQVFDCQAARTGGVIRRQVVDVLREVGLTALVSEIERRGFQLIRTEHHFIIICSREKITVLV